MDSEPASREHLENSRQLAWDRTCSATGWPSAVDHLMALLEAPEKRLRARRSADRARLVEALAAVVLDLYGAHRGDPGRWLAYSRNANDYGAQNRYVLPGGTAKTASTIADFLTLAGLAEHRPGSYRRNPFGGPGGYGYRSRLRALPELVELLEGRFGIRPEAIAWAEWSELVRLKEAPEYPRGPKKLAAYSDTAQTRRMREQLVDLNGFLAGFRIDLEPGASAAACEDEEELEEQIDPGDRSAIRLYRVFNNNRWDHGGRFYGGWWQALPKAQRSRLLIDGEETVELDFRALHPRLCYELDGHPLAPQVDPYTLPGLEGDAVRDAVKRAFNHLLNLPPNVPPRAPAGVREALPRKLSYKALLAKIEAAHPLIRLWFRTGRGVELQNIDSHIASSVLGYFRFRGICCLPVHDSFIVPRSAEFMLGQTMKMAYHGTLSNRTRAISWPVISGWSSKAMEQRVLTSLP